MKKKLVKDISSNTLQVVINQLCAVVIFYTLSIGLDKNDFGALNWALAILLTGFSILSFGIDQVVVKKIASGNDAQSIVSLHIFHVIVSGILFYCLLLILHFLLPQYFQQNIFLLFIGIGKLAIYLSTPFKQLAIGKERFKSLLYMMICSNIIRALLLLIIILFFHLSINIIIIIFIIGDVAELLFSAIISIAILKIPFAVQWNKEKYIALFKESLPLAGVNLFTATMARFDWILIGVFTGNVILADYSFAYKLFEIATLPLLIIAPILMTRFTRFFNAQNPNSNNEIFFALLLKIEMIIASFTALVLIILWIPVIDHFTHGKYGQVNSITIMILAACLPFLYINNFLWTINFAQGKFKMIFYVFAVTFLVNIAGDIVLIPFYKAEGAAVAFLLSLIVQALFFFTRTQTSKLIRSGYAALLYPVYAAAAVAGAMYFFKNIFLMLIVAAGLFFFLVLITGGFRQKDIVKFKEVISR